MIYKEIPEKAFFSTSEVASLLGVSTTTVISYAIQSGLHVNLIRRRRGDYVFKYEDVKILQEFAFAFEED